MTAPRIAVYPGSFDPLTNGHVDIIRRGSRLFDCVIVAILVNAEKRPMFSVEERLEIVRETFRGEPTIEADSFDGLLVDYVRRRHAIAVVRGLRGAADLQYEMQMASLNRHLNDAVETIFLMPAGPYGFVSSSLVKEVAALGGSVTGLVPEHVERRLEARRPRT